MLKISHFNKGLSEKLRLNHCISDDADSANNPTRTATDKGSAPADASTGDVDGPAMSAGKVHKCRK